MDITVTEKAANEVNRILKEQGYKEDEKVYLRLRVTGGGCSGFQNKLDLDTEVKEKTDETYVIQGINVVIDKRSALYLDGVSVDFSDDMNRHGFIVKNPNAKTTCGCGSSFSM
jgi:iron-sulfur cluster assembly protein